uniref:EF-hand domain-containing protein n=1 Tax=Globisporangium ultimum (strain ATCC 200006 / CBS 805.95 / DAOM BR144) TaxID=431595 RepID=K3WYA4_GLOUD
MDVMMNMTTEDVRVLREKFTGKMSLEQFVVLLKNTLHDRIHSELDFVVGVVELFHTIDVNGDEFLDWDEFAGYMMDAGQAKSDFYFEDLRQKKCYQHMPLPLCDDKTPMNSIRSYIQQMLYMHEQNAIAYFEHDSDVVYLYGLHFDRNDGPRHLSTLRLHTAFQEHTIICMAYVATKKLLVISSMLFMGYLSVWCVADLHSPAMVHRVESQCPHEQLTWVPSLQCLLTAAVGFPAISKKKNSRDGYRPNAAAQTYTKLNQLLRWDLVGKTLVSTEFVLKDRLKGVSALETFKCINRTHIAIGSEDGVLIVVDAESWETVSSFDAHGNGVKMLCYSVHVESLASAGFHSYSDETTLHISIWKKKGAAGHLVFETSLKHHDAPVELINFVDSKRQLISLDAGGTFKVYSSVLLTPTSEPWECLQSSQVAPTPTEPNRILSCFVVPETVASDAVLVTAGRTVAFYDLCEVKDREEVFYAHYCQSLNLIMGVTISKVLFWNAETGRLWKAYEYAAILAASTDPAPRRNTSGPACDLGNPRTITAVCMDDRERKVILGDDAGSLKVINAVNGNIMKELDPHHQAISSISYVLHGKRVVSISIDSSLHIYDENNPLGYYVPFRGSHPQSVLLQSLRFLPETQPFSMHCRKQRAKDANEPDWESSHSSVRAPVMTEKFEIVKSIGNQALNKVAVLISGSRGESFVQVWSFDMSHTQGTCIAPRNDEITNICFFGSSADILGGTSSGCMLLWLVSKDDGAY